MTKHIFSKKMNDGVIIFYSTNRNENVERIRKGKIM